jgi:3-oxoacyl-(acyl-carrier-protein) synthase
VITGGGSISPFGAGVRALVDAVRAGRAAVSPGVSEGPGRSAPLVARVTDALGPGPFAALAWRRLDRCSRMAALAAAEALAATGAATAGDRAEVGVILGTMTSGVEPLREFLTTLFREGPGAVSPMEFPRTVPNAPASQCSILLGLKGLNLTVCQMEASGLGAIAAAARLIRDGAAEAILAGGVDEAPAVVLEAWRRLRLLAGPGGSGGGPGRRRAGFVPGEGAYVLLLESAARAAGRRARPWAEVAGSATVHGRGAAHAWPDSVDEPAAALSLAMERAGVSAAELGYVAASANGAARLDALEAEALRRVLGPAAERVGVSRLKGVVGESAAGAAAAALVGAIATRDGVRPKTSGPGDGPPLRSVLVNAIGTGGTCVSVVLTRPREGRP